jgi:hypothetical protein
LDNLVVQLAARALISDEVDIIGIFENVHEPNDVLMVIHFSQERDLPEEAARLV